MADTHGNHESFVDSVLVVAQVRSENVNVVDPGGDDSPNGKNDRATGRDKQEYFCWMASDGKRVSRLSKADSIRIDIARIEGVCEKNVWSRFR